MCSGLLSSSVKGDPSRAALAGGVDFQHRAIALNDQGIFRDVGHDASTDWETINFFNALRNLISIPLAPPGSKAVQRQRLWADRQETIAFVRVAGDLGGKGSIGTAEQSRGTQIFKLVVRVCKSSRNWSTGCGRASPLLATSQSRNSFTRRPCEIASSRLASSFHTTSKLILENYSASRDRRRFTYCHHF